MQETPAVIRRVHVFIMHARVMTQDLHFLEHLFSACLTVQFKCTG